MKELNKMPMANHYGVIGTDEVCRAYPADAVDAYIVELEQRAEAAEAKLAEYEEQDDKSVAWIETSKHGFEKGEKIINYYSEDVQHLQENTKLFTRPAPAVSLAELMMDENDSPHGFTTWYERHFATQPYKGASHVTDCENAWCAAILRKIEETK